MFSVVHFLIVVGLVEAALFNVTIDDQRFDLISYQPLEDWSHDPLLGFEDHFYNGSRSYTWTPGSFLSFSFFGKDRQRRRS